MRQTRLWPALDNVPGAQVSGGWLTRTAQGYVRAGVQGRILFTAASPFSSFLTLQCKLGYFLKECSAKVMGLARLKCCPRFENLPKAVVI